MNINSIRYFVETAKAENITKAAKNCYISQQALSKEIAGLEKELGVLLFTRGSNYIHLSQEGKQLLPIASAMLESYDFYSKTLISAANTSKQALRVLFENDVMMSYLPYDLLGRIGNTYVNTRIAKTSEQCVRDILEMNADLAMLNRPPKEKMGGLTFIELTNNPPYVIVSKNHHLANREYITIEDLRNEPSIAYDINTYFRDECIAACTEAGFYPNIKASWPHLSTVMSAVAAGEGYTLGGNFVKVPHEEKLTRIRLKHKTFRHVVGFIINRNNPRIKEIESYIRAIKSV